MAYCLGHGTQGFAPDPTKTAGHNTLPALCHGYIIAKALAYI